MVESITLLNNYSLEEMTIDKDSAIGFLLDVVNWGVVQATHNSYKFFSQLGTTFYSNTIGERTISITGWIVARSQTAMTSYKSKINLFINPNQLMTLQYSDYEIDFYPDSSITYGLEYSENNDVACKFVIDGTAMFPLFRKQESKIFTNVEIRPLFNMPLVIPSTSVANSKHRYAGIVFGSRKVTQAGTVEVDNEGNFSTGFKIMFASNGTVLNPYVSDANGNIIKILKTINAGETVILNTSSGFRNVFGNLGFNEGSSSYYRYFFPQSNWLELAVGKNYLTIGADSGIADLSINISFEAKYLEVQE